MKKNIAVVFIFSLLLFTGCLKENLLSAKNTEKDSKKPVITLTGSAIVTLYTGDTYIEGGASAVDETDGNITPKIIKTIYKGTVTVSAIDTTTAGAFTIKYNVSDNAGNKADEVEQNVVIINDKPSKSVEYSTTGAIIAESKIEYDNKNNISVIESLYGVNRYKNVYSYNEYGVLEKDEWYYYMNSSYTLINYTIYEYNNRNLVTKTTPYYSDGMHYGYYNTYEYDGKDRLIKTSDFNSTGILERYCTFEYDSNDNMVKKNEYSPEGVLKDYSVRTYDISKEMKNKYYDKMNFCFKAFWSIKNRINETYYYSGEGALTIRFRMEYDEYGRPLKSYRYQPDGTLYSNSIIEY